MSAHGMRCTYNPPWYRDMFEPRPPYPPEFRGEFVVIFHFRDAPGRSQRDVHRRRTIVSIAPKADPEADLHLGTVWRSTSTGRWYFTWEERTLRRLATPEGYATRDDAAIALLEDRMRTARSKTLSALATWNILRRHARLPRLIIEREESPAGQPTAGEETPVTQDVGVSTSVPSRETGRAQQ